jgi:hypothetical protein
LHQRPRPSALNSTCGGSRRFIIRYAVGIADYHSHRPTNFCVAEAGIERNSFGEKYSVYSLRHFYAVNALRNGVGVFEVARNMGTSVQMIQEYYGKQPI